MQLHELMDPDYSDNPFPLYRKLHQQGPLIPAGDKIIISGSHAVVDALLNDRRVGKNYMESVRVRFGDDAAGLPLFQGISRMFLVLNPPDHNRLRGLVMKAFSAREIKSLREMALTIANELVDELEGRRACDLAQAFAFPLPVRIICRMLDVSESDAPELGRLTSALVRVFDPQISQADLLKAAEAFAVLESYFSAVIVSRRDSTASDLVSLFLRSGSDGDRLVFTSPERLNIRRHEGRCLAFGGGIHHCMGYRLALAEMEVALEVLLTRLPEMRPVAAGVRRNHRANLRGVSALPVEW